jgi:hypothetical protein
MMKSLLASFFAGTFAVSASTTVINTFPDWDNNVTLYWFKVAQSFLAPADNTLSSWEFALATNGGQNSVLFQIVPWNPNSGPSGAALFSREVPWPTPGGHVLVSNINLTLQPGARYAAVIDLEGYEGSSVHYQQNQNSYDQGRASWFNSGTWDYLTSTYNTSFRAEFSAVPEPEGFKILFAALLVLAAAPRTFSGSCERPR